MAIPASESYYIPSGTSGKMGFADPVQNQDVTPRDRAYSSLGATVNTGSYPIWTTVQYPVLQVTAGLSSGTVSTVINGPTITNNGPGPASWGIVSNPPGVVFSPSSGVLAPNGSVSPTVTSSATGTFTVEVLNTSSGPTNNATYQVSVQASALPSLAVTAGPSTGATGANVNGPTISAPAGNATMVNWSIATNPTSGITVTPSSGSLNPGQSVTPVVNATVPNSYTFIVTNASGGTITGSAGAINIL